MSKIIIVPSMMHFWDGKLTTSHGVCQIVPNIMPSTLTVDYLTNVNGILSKEVAMVRGEIEYDRNSQGTMFINPLLDYLSWYDFPKTECCLYIYKSDLEQRFVTMTELSTAIETRADDIVLVQAQGHDTWFIFFKTEKDKKMVSDLINGAQPVNVKLITFPEEVDHMGWRELLAEIEEWCRTTLTGKFFLTSSYKVLNGRFKYDSDAALFKLKWTYA
jgi:hypothetical protein